MGQPRTLEFTPKELERLKRMIRAWELFRNEPGERKLIRFGNDAVSFADALIEIKLDEKPTSETRILGPAGPAAGPRKTKTAVKRDTHPF